MSNRLLIRHPVSKDGAERVDMIKQTEINCISRQYGYTYIALKSGFGYEVNEKLSYVMEYYNQNELGNIKFLTLRQGENYGRQS